MNLSIYLRSLWRGRLIGTDAQGNRYYEDKHEKRYGKPKRWVLYKGRVEASKIPPEWFGWMHYTKASPPQPRQPHSWEKPHLPNLTGTKFAHKPKGLKGITPNKDYEAWQPE
jgi:NADH:ubiquinone oxidoreductase subunit